MHLANKRILVTGATGGIGSELCRLLNEAGASIILTCYNETVLEEVRNTLDSRHIAIAADVSTPEGRNKIRDACQINKGIDAIINLAGIMDFSMFEMQSEAMITKMLEINTIAPILMCRLLLPHLRIRESAKIINVGSIFGSIGHPGFAVYCSSKAAIKTFTEALARELDDTNISVSYIAPRATSTKFNSDKVNELNIALGNKSDTPEFVAGKIVELLEQGSSTKFLGWPEKFFVKVNALLPGVVHRALVKNLAVIKHHANS